MLKATRVHLEQLDQKSAVLVLLNQKNVVAYQLGDQVASKLWRDLQSVDAEREEHLYDILYISFALASYNAVLVLLQHIL